MPCAQKCRDQQGGEAIAPPQQRRQPEAAMAVSATAWPAAATCAGASSHTTAAQRFRCILCHTSGAGPHDGTRWASGPSTCVQVLRITGCSREGGLPMGCPASKDRGCIPRRSSCCSGTWCYASKASGLKPGMQSSAVVPQAAGCHDLQGLTGGAAALPSPRARRQHNSRGAAAAGAKPTAAAPRGRLSPSSCCGR